MLEDLYITVRRGTYDQLESTIDMPTIIEAPVSTGQPLAELKIKLGDNEVLGASLRALDDNGVGSLWQRTKDSIALMFE